MKAMILAAGLGTRLRPLTLERAKPAIPLLGKPLVIRLIERLKAEGVSDFRLNLHHLPETVESVFESPAWSGGPVSFSYEQEIMGTAGGLKASESFFDQGTFLMVNGDIVMDFALSQVIAFHHERGAMATLVLYPQTKPYRHFPVRIDKEGRLVNFKNSRVTGAEPLREAFVFTGVHVLEPSIFEFIPPGRFYEINDQTYPDAIRAGKRILGFPVHGYWNDLGDPLRYLDGQRDLLERAGIDPPIYLSPDAEVAEDTSIGPCVSAGPGCRFERNVTCENSVLWDNVRLRKNTGVRDCIIGSEVTVESECRGRIITRNGEAPLAGQ